MGAISDRGCSSVEHLTRSKGLVECSILEQSLSESFKVGNNEKSGVMTILSITNNDRRMKIFSAHEEVAQKIYYS